VNMMDHLPRRRTAYSLLLAAVISLPAFAQVDFTGEWAPLYHEDGPERLPGPELGDYTELPINAAARMAGDTYDADRISVVPEYQCRPHGGDYSMRGLGNLRIWREIDQASEKLVAFHTHLLAWDSERTVWMDGRPHPPDYAPHTWQGFSTGVWEGNMLTITTTHLKTNYMRRNGIPRSDKAVFTEHWTRHGDYLTVVTVIEDPVYLTEPLVRSESWVWNPYQIFQPIASYGSCVPHPELPRPRGWVPHHLPGTNTVIQEFPEEYGVPFEAARGGAETMYPEYQDKLRQMHIPRPKVFDVKFAREHETPAAEKTKTENAK
jgi:hypothetical protein